MRKKAINFIAKHGIRVFLSVSWSHIARYIKNRKLFKAVRFSRSYLSKKHYFGSVPSDEFGITPWFTYPAISMLRQIVSSESKVFEYGSGFSSLYFKSVAAELVSVEHSSKWGDILRRSNPELDVRIHPEESEIENAASKEIQSYLEFKFKEPVGHSQSENLEHGLINRSFSNYALEITKSPPGHFDIIVVDGMARQLCAYMASLYVSHGGLIILDNSDRWQYNDIQKYLIDQGFGRIDFWGPGPINSFGWCTSFFSRNIMIPIGDPLRKRGFGDIGW